jgi:RNA polymerase sigma factor (sigma-70 family)
MRTDERTDADLVAAALAGDRQAVADIYDRYSTVVFTVCVRLLGNRDDAADCAAEVFLRATERLHQLREPEKLKSWLYAIARNEVARRQRRRGREVPVEAIDELPWLDGGDVYDAFDREPELVGVAAATAHDGASSARGVGSAGELERLIQEASAGLTDRDRAVAELGLRQNLQGDELADALGVTTNHAYVLVHRVRARLEKAITAILVARTGRDDCTELQRILAGWDGELTVLLRKRVARHIDRCDICGARRKLVPAALFDAAPVLAAPIAIRHRVLEQAQVATATGRPWSGDGFPRTGGGRRRSFWIAGAAAILVVLGLLAVVVAGGGTDSTVVAERSSVDASRRSGTDPSTDPSAPSGSGPASTVPDLGDAAEAATNTSTSTTVTPGGPDGPVGPGGDVVTPPGPDDPTPDPVSGSLVATPGVVDFGAVTTSQALTLTNTGGTPLAFALGAASSTLSLSPSGGEVAPGASVVVTVGLDRSSLGDTFASTIDGQASGGPISIPVLAVNSIAPNIVSATKPNQFGPSVSANPGCDVVVDATDNGTITEVRVIFDNPATPGNPADFTTVLAPAGPGRWRGQLLVNAAGPVTGFWHVVVRDSVGNERSTTPQAAVGGSFCLP